MTDFTPNLEAQQRSIEAMLNNPELEAELSIQRVSKECADEEAKRLGRIIKNNVEVMHMHQQLDKGISPTLEVEQTWNRIRWHNPDENDEDITHA